MVSCRTGLVSVPAQPLTVSLNLPEQMSSICEMEILSWEGGAILMNLNPNTS